MKIFKNLAVLAVVSASAVLALVWFADIESVFRYASFDRKIVGNAVKWKNELDLRFQNYYIAGHTDSRIFLANSSDIAHIVAVDSELKDSSHIRIDMPDIGYNRVTAIIDSPYFYLGDGTIPFLYEGSVMDWRPREIKKIPHFLFFRPISNGSLVYLAWNLSATRLLKPDIQGTQSFRIGKEHADFFASYGLLHYDRSNAKLAFVNMYTNGLLYLDTTLQPVYRKRTIDTIGSIKMKTARVRSKITKASPSFSVNRSVSIDKGQLFVNSGIPSKNDDRKAFRNSSVIDVYDLQDGGYSHSFYIPNQGKLKISGFQVIDSNLIALHGNRLVRYRLERRFRASFLSLSSI